MKVKRFKSFRFKMVMYMFFSLIATFITEGLIFMGIYLYETEIIAGEYKKVWGASGQGNRGPARDAAVSFSFFKPFAFVLFLPVKFPVF